MNKIKIYLADDHAILREGIRLILSNVSQFEIVGETGDGKEALEEIEALKPDVAVLDISMPTIDGFEITRQIRKYYPNIRIIILTKHDSEEMVDALLKLGIHGFILKEEVGSVLVQSIKGAMLNNVTISPRITRRLVTEFTHPLDRQRRANDPYNPFTLLTARERQILKLIAEGKSNREIAPLLRISPPTVKGHRINIMRKLNIHKVAELVKYAIKNNIIEL